MINDRRAISLEDSVPSVPAAAARHPYSARLACRILRRIESGSLDLVMPDGSAVHFRGSRPGPTAHLHVRDWRAFRRLLRGSDIAIGQTLRDDWIASPDLTVLLRLLLDNADALGRAFYGGRTVLFAFHIAHAMRRNTRVGSRRNIRAHYDLGNAFYELWLDRTMTYSSALFGPARDLPLEDAQRAKYERVLQQLEPRAGARILEIGCGWGAFAEYAASTRDVHVTAITISEAQYEFARRRVIDSGLGERIDVRLVDYRDVDGVFDHVVSIEMLEAVGERFWPTWFARLRSLLKAQGSALVQTITIDRRFFPAYRRQSDFIREFIFPGGLLMPPERFVQEAGRAGLREAGRLCFGPDYAHTLRAWRARFEAALDAVRAQGFDERFIRLWRMYLCYCEVGFDSGRTDVMQSLLVPG